MLSHQLQPLPLLRGERLPALLLLLLQPDGEAATDAFSIGLQSDRLVLLPRQGITHERHQISEESARAGSLHPCPIEPLIGVPELVRRQAQRWGQDGLRELLEVFQAKHGMAWAAV